MTDGRDWLHSDEVRSMLARLTQQVEAEVAGAEPMVRAMASTLVRRGGKRIRPALLLLTVQLGPGASLGDEALRVAAAVELLHLASLYHDDVMDRATVRRHGPSVNAMWGERASVLAGTYLVAQAVRALVAVDPDCSALTAQALTDLCRGQLLESEHAFDLSLTEDVHLEALRLKTATLFELPVALGSRLGNLDEATHNALIGYGRDLGVAFQLVDDALDVRGTAQALGKRPLSDVHEGVYTLSVLRALALPGPHSTRLRLLLALEHATPSDMAEVAALVLRTGVVDEVLDEAHALCRRAQQYLHLVPAGPVHESLDALAREVVERAT